MLVGILVPALIFRLSGMAMIACLVSFAYGIVGFLDDFIKIVKKRSLGLKAYQKIIGQFGIALITALYAYYSPEIGSSIYLPFSGGELDLGWAYIPVAIFVIIAGKGDEDYQEIGGVKHHFSDRETVASLLNENAHL